MTSYASGQFEVTSITQIQDFIQKEQLNNDLLIVLDIDNTVMKMNKNFGSDQWFNWQKDLLGTSSEDLLVKDFAELLELQNVIFSLSYMSPVEKGMKSFIEGFQKKNISLVALTSRGPEMRNNTLRELERANIDFSHTAIEGNFDISFKRATTYRHGIFMTSGQLKGEMLKYLIETGPKRYRHIIFVDDHKKHTDNVYNTFKDSESEIYTFRYGHEDERVQRFQASEKIKSKRLGKQTLALLNNTRKESCTLSLVRRCIGDVDWHCSYVQVCE